MSHSSFGTEMGLYTIAELRDLIKAKDQEMQAMTDAYNHFAPTWHGADADDFANDWHALLARYAAARTIASAAMANTSIFIPDNMNPVDSEYHGVINALIQHEGMTAKGDFQDLYNRLTTAQNKPVEGKDFHVGQPTKGSDADENALKATGNFMDHLNKAKPAIALSVAGIAASALASVLPIPILGIGGIVALGTGVYWTMKDFGLVK